MNDLQWLAAAAALMAVLCYLITSPDRRSARHWWRRRGNGREVPWPKVVLAFLPLVLALAAASLSLLGLRADAKERSAAAQVSPR